MQHGSFWTRRIHSLLGVVPIGAFVVEHMFTNSFSTHGPQAYNAAVGTLQKLPYLLWIEVFVIFLPILAHAVYGVYIAWQARYNAVQYPWLRNWMFALQRLTGVILFVYIGLHVWETRIQAAFDESLKQRFFEHMQQLLSNDAYFALYVLGVMAAAFHLANGLWTFGIVWGLTAGPKAQRLSSWACTGVGVIVAGMGINSLLGFFQH